jgi:hypothetical protein
MTRQTLIFFILLLKFSYGQKDNGFYGNKAIVQTEGLFNYPFFYNVITKSSGDRIYKAKDGKLIESNDLMNSGYRLSLGYAIKRNMAVLIEFGQDFANVYPDRYPIDYPSYQANISQHEKLNTMSTCVLPKVEFASSKSLLPLGLGHQIGFGVERTRIFEKDYLYRLDYYLLSDSNKVYSQSKNDLDPINFDLLPVIKRFVIMYALSIRTPLSKHLLLNYGVRYSARFGNVKKLYLPSVGTNNLPYGNEEFTNAIIKSTARMRNLSVINVNVGLTYTF